MNKVDINKAVRGTLKDALDQLFPGDFNLQITYKDAGTLAYDVTVNVTVGTQPKFSKVYRVDLGKLLDLAGLGNNILGEVKAHFGKDGVEVEPVKREKKAVKSG